MAMSVVSWVVLALATGLKLWHLLGLLQLRWGFGRSSELERFRAALEHRWNR